MHPQMEMERNKESTRQIKRVFRVTGPLKVMMTHSIAETLNRSHNLFLRYPICFMLIYAPATPRHGAVNLMHPVQRTTETNILSYFVVIATIASAVGGWG